MILCREFVRTMKKLDGWNTLKLCQRYINITWQSLEVVVRALIWALQLRQEIEAQRASTIGQTST